ncbi:MAG: hypothetical protein CMC15_18700 [Flavobacteriaceae bacterium]|nr:hypothetical protein [Flavobacteriaceae bacterium]
MAETKVSSEIRLDGAYRSIELWRNNVGVLRNQDGTPVRYGLANTSKKVNREIKSSDLIGITPVFITPDMVGKLVGVFTAVETKAENWVFNQNDKHCLAQKNYHDIVLKAGGYAGFATCVKDFRKIIRHDQN